MINRFISVIIFPLITALALTSIILWALGIDPLTYFSLVLQRGLFSPSGLQAVITRMAPLLLIAAGLIVAFRAGIWNLGGDGQYLLASVTVAAVAPSLTAHLPLALAWIICFAIAACIGAFWALLPALLKAYRGINEIIASLMMTFLGISLANVLIKLFFRDTATTVPQTVTLPVSERLPRLADTTISSGVLVGIAAIILVHWIMTRTAFGLRLRVVGLSTRAAVHAGINVPLLTIIIFSLSAGLAGMAGAVDILGVYGTVRADWNPAYNLMVVPLVFLARLNGYGSIIFVFLFSVLSVGGESASRRLGVPNYVTLLIVSTLLVALAIGEVVYQHILVLKPARKIA